MSISNVNLWEMTKHNYLYKISILLLSFLAIFVNKSPLQASVTPKRCNYISSN